MKLGRTTIGKRDSSVENVSWLSASAPATVIKSDYHYGVTEGPGTRREPYGVTRSDVRI